MGKRSVKGRRIHSQDSHYGDVQEKKRTRARSKSIPTGMYNNRMTTTDKGVVPYLPTCG